MRVLLTGHDGYIGTRMGGLLMEAGHEVIGLDAGLFSTCVFEAPGLEEGPPETVHWQDIRDVRALTLGGVDAVIHLANLSNDPLGNLDPDLTDVVNHRATVRLARLARSAGVRRFLFASSCSLYGAAGEEVVTEEASFNPVTPYGQAKADAEAGLRALASDDFSPIFLRNATVYGLSPRLRFDLVVNNLTAWAVATGRIRMKSDGTPWRPLVHVDDVCRAFITALEAPREVIHNEAFNVGADTENYRIREVAESVREVVPGCEVTFAEGASSDRRSYRVSFAKIRDRLPGWTPQWTVRKGAHQVFEALKGRGISPDVFEGSRFSRIAHLRRRLSEGTLDATLRCAGASNRLRERI